MSDAAARYPLKSDSVAETGGRSRLAVVLGTALSLSTVVGCLVCGAGLYVFRPSISEDPDAVAPLAAEMLRVDVPTAFEPRGTIEWDFFWLVLMRGVYYELTGDEGMLMFLQVDSGLMREEDIREHVERTLREKGGGGPPLTITTSEERVYEVRGRKVTFNFRVGESPADRTKHHLVEGIVDGNAGAVLVAFRITDESWAENEPLVVETIRSIK